MTTSTFHHEAVRYPAGSQGASLVRGVRVVVLVAVILLGVLLITHGGGPPF